jgi:hypothetical protein
LRQREEEAVVVDPQIGKKYEILQDYVYVWEFSPTDGVAPPLHRIRALRDFEGVTAGDLGGYVEGEHNLSQEGNCWLFDNAKACGKSSVSGNASVACAAMISDNAKVYGSARVLDRVRVEGNAEVYGNSQLFGEAEVSGDAKVYDNAVVMGFAHLQGTVYVHGDALLSDLVWSHGGITFSMSDVVNMVMNTPAAAAPLMWSSDSMDDFVKYVMSTPKEDDTDLSLFEVDSP